jgi:hypothetical protein
VAVFYHSGQPIGYLHEDGSPPRRCWTWNVRNGYADTTKTTINALRGITKQDQENNMAETQSVDRWDTLTDTLPSSEPRCEYCYRAQDDDPDDISYYDVRCTSSATVRALVGKRVVWTGLTLEECPPEETMLCGRHAAIGVTEGRIVEFTLSRMM